MFESLTEYVSGSPWTYLFLFVIAALDVIIPLVPSETSVILAGVLASTGDLHLVLVILFAAAGAIVGDNTAYWIGRDRKSTRLNSSHSQISYAVFCLKKKIRIDEYNHTI